MRLAFNNHLRLVRTEIETVVLFIFKADLETKARLQFDINCSEVFYRYAFKIGTNMSIAYRSNPLMWNIHFIFFAIKVEPPVAGRPPRRSLRAVLPHRAPLNGRAVEVARLVSTVEESPCGGSLIGLFYDAGVGNGERFPNLDETHPVEARPLAAPVQCTEDDPTRPTPVPPETIRVSDYP